MVVLVVALNINTGAGVNASTSMWMVELVVKASTSCKY